MTRLTERRKFWVQTTVKFCPVCLGESRYRTRMPLPRPTNLADRMPWVQVHCGCPL